MLNWVGVLNQGRSTLQCFAVGFVAVGVVVEHSISAADGPRAVAFGIERKTDAGSGIEQMAIHAARRHAVDPTLHHAIERIAGAGDESASAPSSRR